MSSVISYKSSATNQTSYSVRSELRSAVSGYSRNGSAYSKNRKDVIDQERKSEMNELVQKQLLEQERHKKLMLENKKRTKMQQEQLKKELEDKRQQEEELLRKMKEEKQTAYMRYLKDNSKEILQNFKKKDSNGNPDESKNLKKAQLAPIGYAKNKPTSAEPLLTKASRSKISGISNQQDARNNKPASANSNLNLPRVRELPQEHRERTPDNTNNLNALDLEFNRSTNNFKKIIDQYHKEMHNLKSQQGTRTQPDEMAIPLQQFYDAQAQQYLPMPPSKLLESLDLSSSLTKWDPSKPLDPSLEPFWHAEEPKRDLRKDFNEAGKYGNYGGYGRQEHRKEEEEPEWEKEEEEDKKEEEVDEIIEPYEEDSIEYDKASNVSSNINGRNIQRKKLVKASEVSQKELKQNWHLQYIDSQSQIKSKPPVPGTSITPKNLPSIMPKENVMVNNKDPKSLGSIPNEEKQKPEPQEQKRRIISAKEARESLDKELDYGNYGVFQQQTGLNFKWAAEAQEDDFYKGLDRQVPSRTKNRTKEEKKSENNKAVVQDSGSKVNAMFADEEWEGISNVPSQQGRKTSVTNNKPEKPEVKKNTRIVKPEEVKKINPVPKINSKPASVVSATSQTKKGENEKENKSRNSGLVSKLQGQVKAAAVQGIPNNKAKKPPVNSKGGRRPDSPTTKCTRDTDLDVEEFLKDDFELINKEEAHLQREILNMHAKEIGKVRAVEQKHNINTGYQNTQQYVTRNPAPQTAGGSQNEDDLEESLERLDIILAKQRNAASNKPATNPPNQQNKPSQPPVYQKENSLYNQVMQNPIPKPQPTYQPAPIQDNNPPVNPYRDAQPNLNPNYPPSGYGAGYSNYPQPMQNMPPYDPYYAAQHHQQQQVYANINLQGGLGGPQGGLGGPQGYPMGQQEPVYSPEFGYNKGLQVPNNYYQPPYQPENQQFMQQKPQYPPPINQQQPQNMMGGGHQGHQGQQGGYGMNMNMGGRNAHEESFGKPVQNQNPGQNDEYHSQLQFIYGNELKISQVPLEGENEDKMKTFSFGNNLQPNANANGPAGGYRDLARGNNKEDISDKQSVVSSKAATDMTMDRSVNEERGAGGSYANKKQVPSKGYGAAKKPAGNKGKEGSNEEVTKGEGDVKIVANTNLKHLLFE